VKIHPRHWKSLSSEITLVYTSLSVTLVVLLSFISYQLQSRTLEARIRQDLLQTIDQTLRGINAEIEERVREVQSLTMAPALRDAAEHATRRTEAAGLMRAPEEEVAAAARSRRPAEAVTRAEAFLQELKQSHPYIAEVFITDRYGINAAASNPTTDLRQNDETWWQEAFTQRYHLSNLEFDQSAGVYSYSVALPIPDKSGKALGVVKAVFNLRAIQELVNSVKIGHGGYLVVLSRDGRVLSHPDPRQLFRIAANVPDLAPVSGLITSSLRGVSDFDPNRPGLGGEGWLIGYSRLMRPASLGPLDWTVAALVSRSEVIEPIVSVRNSAFLAGLIFILAAVPLVCAVSKRLSRPLVDLARRADLIRQGDLDVNLEVPSSNEIGTMASALSAMVENLKASHRRTLEINAGLEKTVRQRTEELQRKNRQIEAQNKKVMEASRLKSQFLANMSHELRTPLNAVLALSEILGSEMSGPLNEDQSKQVTIINRSGKALLRLINDVLDLSKIEAGRMSVERAPMSLHGLITLVVDTLRPLAEDKNLHLEADLAEGLPPFIKADEHKLRQILINLVGNGIKFTENGGVRFSTAHSADARTISFTVADTGIGIAPEATERTFEEFHQADGSTTRKYGGTGLGLTISRKMAELMGGTLTVESEVGQGSAFTLTIPYEIADPIPATDAETIRRVRLQLPEPSLMCTTDDSDTALSSGKPVVLVAEDEQDNLYVMKKYLNRCGCAVVFARDGNEVLEKARTFQPIAITLDLVLPKKSGWDVLSELKSDPATRNIPVIIASVLDNEERGYCLGAYRYLVKPIKETDLSDCIHQIQWEERKNVKRILVVDDNMVDIDLVTKLLTESRYDVLQASRGDEGLATAIREKPDLIMLDLTMPGMDGIEVLEGLRNREETKDIPVIIYTAKDLDPREEQELGAAAQKILLKNPLEPGKMLAEIGSLLKALPRRSAPDDAPEQEPAGAPTEAEIQGRGATPPTEPDDDQVTVLLVEDDPANQYTLTFILESAGYEVTVAENGQEGIEKAAQIHPDIILMDMMMPVMGGHEATRVLKDTPGAMDIPVIALTAAAMAGDREKALAAGCDDYVSKPVNRAHLLERLAFWSDPTNRPS